MIVQIICQIDVVLEILECKSINNLSTSNILENQILYLKQDPFKELLQKNEEKELSR